MPLPKKHYSRLNPRYLASRYAGTAFMLLALGLLAGLAYRLLVQPSVYSSHAEVAVTVKPDESYTRFNWDAKETEWRDYLRDRRDWGLLSSNLRHAVKLALTEDSDFSDRDFTAALSEFVAGKSYSASLFKNSIMRRFGPILEVGLDDLGSYIDFQSLAVIVSDLKPPAGRTDWDFSFFRENLQNSTDSGVIAYSDITDKFFQVFYRLHELMHDRPALTGYAAWRNAVDEVNNRLEREVSYADGGGFGKIAIRELLREIEAIPLLAANCLYHANGWFAGDGEIRDLAAIWAKRWSDGAFVNILAHGRANAVVSAGINLEVRPIGFPRDTAATRIARLAAATLLNFIAARESAPHTDPDVAATTEATVAAAEPPELSANFIAELPEIPVVEPPEAQPIPEPTPVYVELYDEVAAKQQQSLIRMHEESVKLANVEREAALRQLYSARAASNRLSHEAIVARNRADKLRERHDEMAADNEKATTPAIPPQTLELFQRRDELLARLASLREYCTEEHPFVKLALRDLRVVEGMLVDYSPDENANRDAEARATRLATLYLEWESATAQADGFEERASRHDETIACLLDEVANLERCISQREMELAQAREAPVPIIRVPASPPPEILPPEPVAPVVVEAVELPPAPVRTPAPPPREIVQRLAFARLPAQIHEQVARPNWNALWWGLIGGCLASVLWVLARELLADRFRNVAEAHRLVGLPVLASLPMYDQRSVQLAAESVKGELVRTRPGRLQFMPLPVEAAEPPAEARRGKINPAKRRHGWEAWALGILFVVLAGLLYYRSLTGFAPPLMGKEGALSLPSVTAPMWQKEIEGWGDRP